MSPATPLNSILKIWVVVSNPKNKGKTPDLPEGGHVDGQAGVKVHGEAGVAVGQGGRLWGH